MAGFGLRKTIFVFGSNRQGRHGKGAALHALNHCGAIWGRPEGRQGDAYAIVTKELRPSMPAVMLDEVKLGVERLLAYARLQTQFDFKVSPIGCGLAGFTPEQMAPLFRNRPKNVELPVEFLNVLEKS